MAMIQCEFPHGAVRSVDKTHAVRPGLRRRHDSCRGQRPVGRSAADLATTLEVREQRMWMAAPIGKRLRDVSESPDTAMAWMNAP